MKKYALSIIIAVCVPQKPASAIHYEQLSAVKLMRGEKRFEEAIQKLDSMAAKTADADENFHYLNLAVEIAAASLKDAERALALAQKITDPGRRDYASLSVLADFKRYDEALERVRGKNIDEWHVRCRGGAHLILSEIYHQRGDEEAAQQHRLDAVAAAGSEVAVRGSAATAAGQFYLKQGELQKAEEMFRKALSISPAFYVWRNASLTALSRLLVQNQRAKEAVALFEGMEFSKVENVHSRGQLMEAHARALLAAGRKIRAVEVFDALLQSGIPADWRDRINRELDQMAEDF
jgi:tetratricopeptide (TPR) repeat protein